VIRYASVLLLAAGLFAVENPWSRVQELKNRAELRIYRKGVAEPVNALFCGVTDDVLIAVVRNAQVSFAKNEIDRLDARPASAAKRTVKPESKVKTEMPDGTPHPQRGLEVPRDSWSGGVSFGSDKPDFETICRRQSAK
jgi:hypothetical protein